MPRGQSSGGETTKRNGIVTILVGICVLIAGRTTSRTPTLAIVTPGGVLIGAWTGQLQPSQERDVEQALAGLPPDPNHGVEPARR